MPDGDVVIKDVLKKIALGGIFILLVPVMISVLTGVDLARGCINVDESLIGSDDVSDDGSDGKDCISAADADKFDDANTSIGGSIAGFIAKIIPILQWFVVLFTLAVAVAMFYGPGRQIIAYQSQKSDK